MVSVEFQQPVIAHFSELKRKSASLDKEVIRQLLTGKRNIELKAAVSLRFCRKIRQKLRPCRALSQMSQFFVKSQIFIRQVGNEISYHPAVISAGRRTHGQDTLYI